MRFARQVALVTGASRGIGREIAVQLGAEGATVLVVARTQEGLDETKALISNSNGECHVLRTDLRDSDQIAHLAKTIEAKWKSIDILVNNAGVWHDSNEMYAGHPLCETPADQIDEVLDVGIRAPMQLTRLLLPPMIARGSGKILQISGGFSGTADAAGWLHYYVSKKALEHFTQGLAEELREHEIQVNCLSPWFVATDPVYKFFPDEAAKAIQPEEVAKYAIFLLSGDADHCTGQIITVRNRKDH